VIIPIFSRDQAKRLSKARFRSKQAVIASVIGLYRVVG
jgi:hypothetical protein